MSIALALVSLFLLVVFIIFSHSEYLKSEKEKYNFFNHFCFEILPLKSSPIYIWTILTGVLSLLTFSANFIYYAISDFAVINVIAAFIAVLFSFSAAAIFFLNLTKFRERGLFSIVLFVGLGLLNAVLLYQETFIIRAYQNNLIYIAVAVNGLIFLISLVAIFFPKLFDFSLTKNEEGESVRKSFYPLAFFEWMMIFTYPLTQIAIIIIEIIKK